MSHGRRTLRMQMCVLQRGIKAIGWEPSWCWSNPKYQEPHIPFLNSQLREQVSTVRMVVWHRPGNIRGFAPGGKSYKKDRRLLNHQRPLYAHAPSLLSRAVGEALSPIK